LTRESDVFVCYQEDLMEKFKNFRLVYYKTTVQCVVYIKL